MKKRADLIGAELFISSEQDYGTQIKIIKPENVLYKHRTRAACLAEDRA